ncbi:MAG TPA: class I SAM-dependent methyltransferase [Phycisphaerae bacterium]|nr:class I SAM-dependent methyltransferase [Phycisphaerae bacterium]
MNLLELVRRSPAPNPWSEGANIPWDEAAFSRRMLAEHLSDSHDAASRRGEKIDHHVQWIHRELCGGRATKVLDLCCGPGLYSSRLARLGHDCVGIDFSPASIEYARGQVQTEGLRCKYECGDVRTTAFGGPFGLAMLIFGEFNVFRPGEARALLADAYAALGKAGLILIEAHRLEAVERIGGQGRSWYSADSGLFSDRPHVCLQESCWEQDTQTATVRYYVLDAQSGAVTRHAATYQGYTDAEYRALLSVAGFPEVTLAPSLTGSPEEGRPDFVVLIGRK